MAVVLMWLKDLEEQYFSSPNQTSYDKAFRDQILLRAQRIRHAFLRRGRQ